MRCISPVYVRKSGKFVPCQKCNFCLQAKRADWSFRIDHEHLHSETAFFLTLTYEGFKVPIVFDDYWAVRMCYPYVLTLVKDDIQSFIKSLRKLVPSVKLRYFLVGEYGEEFERPHYHIILFNLPVRLERSLEDVWGKGFVHVGNVEMASIHYVTKYVINKSKRYSGREPPFAFMSKRPGIGAGYIHSHRHWHKAGLRSYTNHNGYKGRLSRYYKERIFNQHERERLAFEALDKEAELYAKEIARIEKYHCDPYRYYDERLLHMHASIESKVIKQKSKF